MKNETYRRLRKRLTVLFLCCSFLVLCFVSVVIALLSYYSNHYADAGLLQNSDFLLFYLQHSWQINMILYAVSYFIFLLIGISLFFRNMNILVMALQGNVIQRVPLFFRIFPEFQTARHKVENMIARRNDGKQRSDEERQHKNELLMYLAHDLKTPLTSLIGYINHILDHHVDEAQTEKSLSIACTKAHRLDELIDEFEEILRYDDKVNQLDIMLIDLSELIRHQMDGFYPLMEQRKLKAEVILPEHVYIEADYDKLQRLFDNLMRNAITYSNAESIIYIQAEVIEQHVQITYCNDGEELQEHAVSHLFDKFYRASTARTSSSGGAGLGLAIAKEIVELHHGVIGVHKDGRQIVFTIQLPIKRGDSV